MLKFTRRPFAVAAVALAVCSTGSRSLVRAEDKMMDDKMKMTDDKMKMTDGQAEKMKTMAADPAQAQQMSTDLAKMMVMDHMAMEMAKDPQFQQMRESMKADPNMMKVHDEAKKMADDPATMEKMKQEVMTDPKAMGMVMHMAMKMSMAGDMKMGGMDHGNMNNMNNTTDSMKK